MNWSENMKLKIRNSKVLAYVLANAILLAPVEYMKYSSNKISNCTTTTLENNGDANKVGLANLKKSNLDIKIKKCNNNVEFRIKKCKYYLKTEK